MKLLECRRCGGTIEYARKSGRGRTPWYCKICVKAIEVERIQARNIADRARRRADREPLCRDCRMPLNFDDSGPRRDMHTYCLPAGQDGNDRRTAAASARSLEQRKRTKWGDRLVLLVGLAKGVQQEYMAVTASHFPSISRNWAPGPFRTPRGRGRKALRTCASPKKFFRVRTRTC